MVVFSANNSLMMRAGKNEQVTLAAIRAKFPKAIAQMDFYTYDGDRRLQVAFNHKDAWEYGLTQIADTGKEVII